MSEWPAYAAIIMSLGTLIWTATRGRSEIAHTSALTAGELADQVRQLVKDVKEERDARRKLEDTVRSLISDVRNYEIGVSRLVKQIQTLGHEPVWEPPILDHPVFDPPWFDSSYFQEPPQDPNPKAY